MVYISKLGNVANASISKIKNIPVASIAKLANVKFAAPVLILHDNFNRTGLLHGDLCDTVNNGNTWQAGSFGGDDPTCQTTNGGRIATVSGGDVRAIINSTISDFTAEIVASNSDASTSTVEMWFRCTTAPFTNGYQVIWDPNDIILSRWTSGALTTISSVNNAAHSIGTRTIKAVCEGTSIQVYVDNILRISTTSATHQTNTYFGVRLSNSANQSFINDFKVYTL